VELAYLKAFVSVADAGTISGAAPGLGYSQPGLSQRVESLERRLGCDLFVRSARGVKLTAEGDIVLPYARIIVSVDREMRDALASGADGVG
jgi:DNA-binding transcriptional LysR family regulator